MTKKISFSIIACMISMTRTLLLDSPCSFTTYQRGKTTSEWNYNITTIPDQISWWLDSQEESEKSFIQSAKTIRQRNSSLCWQWRNNSKISGFLYGKVDENGEFSGENISFIYPDFLTGLKGVFEAGILRSGQAVDVVAERCHKGIKELKLEPAKDGVDTVWENHGDKMYDYGKNPRVMDPHERKSVYVQQSTNPRAKEGLFAKRKFQRGDLVSYLGGEKLFLRDIIFPNMTVEDMTLATMYAFGLGARSTGLLLDVRGKYRSVDEYKTTLAHKANHKFDRNNVIFQKGINHPVLGDVAGLVAVVEIEPDEEIFADYNYDLQLAAPWYREEYNILFGKCLLKTDDNICSKIHQE